MYSKQQTNMTDLFVPYQQSLELKQLGFDEPCFAKYFQQDGNTPFIQIGETEIEEAESAGDDVTFECNAPTFSQAFAWFREKHGLHSWITMELGYSTTFCWVITGEKNSTEHKAYFKTHEEAELACLIRLIEIIKK